MTVYIQKVKRQLHSDFLVFCKNTFLANIQYHHVRTEGGRLDCFGLLCCWRMTYELFIMQNL